jgi:hypothetical protein
MKLPHHFTFLGVGGARKEGKMLGTTYTTVIGMILLFPWLVLALMVAGCLREGTCTTR